MRKISKILSIILALIMVISIFPMSTITASAATYSGTCGENVTWEFDEETGTLTISGTDAMDDLAWYQYGNYGAFYDNRPWKSYASNIKNVVINVGVTTISDYAFSSCKSLTSVTIGNSVITIGDDAFSSCINLTSVTIGNSVTTIGDEAFDGCDSLTSVTIPDSVTTIGDDAFSSCDSLTSITVDSNNKNYSSDGYGVLFNKDKTTLIKYPIGNTRISYRIPDSVTTIGDSAFLGCESLTSVTIGNSVTTISDYAFEFCKSLTSVTIPDSVTKIGFYAFYYCTSLTSIIVDDNNKNYSSDEYGVLFNKDKTELAQYPIGSTRTSYSIPDSVTTVGNSAFSSSASLTSVTIPDSVTTLAVYAFSDCDSLTSVIIPDSVTSIYWYAFVSCESLTSVTIPNSITTIGSSAFNFCDSLTDVYYNGTEEQWNKISIENNNEPLLNAAIHFAKDSNPKGTCGENVTWEFDPTTGTLTISGTGAMDDYDYDNRPWGLYEDNIKTVVINNGVTTIGDYAFADCQNLASVTIGNTVTTIGEYVFCENYSLTSIIIPDSVITISDYAFDFCYGLANIIVDNNNQHYSNDEYGVLFNKDKTTLIRYPIANTRASYTIPDSVTTISEDAFLSGWGLGIIVIPESVTTIGSSAFCDTFNLTDVYYGGTEEEWNNISIGSNNEYLLNAIIHFAKVSNPSGTCGENVTWEFDPTTGTLTISGTGDMYDFSTPYNGYITPWRGYINDIQTVNINNGVTSISAGAFIDCYNLENVTIPESVTIIGDYAFHSGSSLTSVTVDSDNQYYSSDEYGVLFNKNKTTLIQYPTGNPRTSYTIPNGVTTIGNYAFYYCSSLANVTIPNGVTTIGNYAFYYCSSLANVTIPDNVTIIGDGTFMYCFALDIKLNNRITTIGDYAFAHSGIGNITIPDSVATIGEGAFQDCTFNNITIGVGVKTIGKGAFSHTDATGCTFLTDVYYNGTEEQWNQISIESWNDDLLNATIHYNYIDPDKFTGIKGDYFYWNDVRLKAYQLVEFEGDYYFINDGHKIAKNKRIYLSQKFVEGTDLKVGYYDFDADGKLICLNGPVGDYFYKDNVRQKAYQLVEFEGNYYFINDGHKIAKNKRIYLSERFVEGTDLKVGYYEFDSEGKMVYLNGPVGDYFYKDNVRQKAYQLVEFEGDYYFINDSHKLAKNKRIYLSERFVEGTDLKVGYYEFDADGKMVYLNGPVGDYFYKDNVRLKAYQLVEFEGDYYFINDSHKLAKNKRIYLSQRFVEGTDLKVGWYNFDADGKMIIE